jgi:hypothetical protein
MSLADLAPMWGRGCLSESSQLLHSHNFKHVTLRHRRQLKQKKVLVKSARFH